MASFIWRRVGPARKVPHPPAPERYPWVFLVLLCRPVVQILTLFKTTKSHFSHPFSDLDSKKYCHHFLDKKSNKKYFLKSILN